MAIVHVADTAGSSGGVAAANQAISGVSATTGNWLVLWYARSGGAATGSVSGITDTGGNTWTVVTRGGVSGVSNTRIEVWACRVAALPDQITVAASSSQTNAWNYAEFSGVASVSPIDVKSADLSGTTSSTSCTTPSITTLTANDMIMAGIHYPQATGTLNQTGWTALANFDDSTNGSGRAAYILTQPIATYSCNWTLGSAQSAGAVTIAIKASTGGSIPVALADTARATDALTIVKSGSTFFGTGRPAGMALQIEFTANTWTDVTADVDLDTQELVMQRGRNSPFSPPSVGTLAVALDNATGKYTPQRSVLNDGVTTHPYYPNVQPRKRIRFLYTPPAPVSVSPFSDPTFENSASLFNLPWSAVGGGSVTIASVPISPVHSGSFSLQANWVAGSGEYVHYLAPLDGAGLSYVFQAWVNVPTGNPTVHLAAVDPVSTTVMGTSSSCTANGTWQQLTVTFTSLSSQLDFQLVPTSNPTGSQVTYLDDITATVAQSIRFQGFIQAWPMAMEGTIRPVTVLSATDWQDQLGRVELVSPILQEVTNDVPYALWPLTDPQGTFETSEQSGNMFPGLVVAKDLTGVGSGGAGSTPVTFGNTGPPTGDGTAVTFTNTATDGGHLQAGTLSRFLPVITASTPWAFTMELYFATTYKPAGGVLSCLISSGDPYHADASALRVCIDSSGDVVFGTVASPSLILLPNNGNGINYLDGAWHHVLLTYTSNGTTASVQLVTDGIGLGAPTTMTRLAHQAKFLFLGKLGWQGTASSLFSGSLGWAAYYPFKMSDTRILAHAAARNGYAGDTTDTRIARWLTVAQVPSQDQVLDVGSATMASYPQGGTTLSASVVGNAAAQVITTSPTFVDRAMQDVAITEGGDAVAYVLPNGKVRFAGRTYRQPGAPTMTIDAAKDLDASVWSPTYDQLTLVNFSTATQSTEESTVATLVVQDTVSQAEFGITTDAFTSYAQSTQDVQNNAEYRVAMNAYPNFRLPQLQVDLASAENNLYNQLALVQIGSRLRLTAVPAAAAPTSQVDVLVEGWTETVTPDSYIALFDASPADSPARFVWDDPVYGNWQCAGQTLSATITAGATSLVIVTPGTDPTFSVSVNDYPLYIQIDEEVILLTAKPGGSTTPQTFTSVTRGQQGTTAAPHTAGAVITLWPQVGWSL